MISMAEPHKDGKSYYLSYDGIQHLGPFPLRHIRAMVRRRELRPEILIRAEHDTSWERHFEKRQSLDNSLHLTFASALFGVGAIITAVLYLELV